MSIQKKYVFPLLAVIALVVVIAGYGLDSYLTVESLKKNKELMQQFVDEHYLFSVMLFILFFISTAFFVPGAIIATIAGGFLYGVIRGAIFVNIGSTIGATLAFLLSRHLIGNWVQRKYRAQLELFNAEIRRYGSNYLFMLRIIPVLPFFLINYLTGLTRISLRRFIATTSLGMLPGSFVYAYAGQRLSEIRSLDEVSSPGFIIMLSLMALFAILPVIVHHVKGMRG